MWNAVAAGLVAAFSAAGVSASYRRGDTELDVTVLPGSMTERSASPNLPIQYGDAAFILPLAAIESVGLPLEGDELIVDFGGRLQTLRLDQQPDGSKSWRYMPGNEYVRLTLTRVNDEVGTETDHDVPTEAQTVVTKGLKWQLIYAVASLGTVNLGKNIAAGDVIRLVVDIGENERTLTYFGGRDFALSPPTSISLTGLPVGIGDTLIITNFGTPRE